MRFWPFQRLLMIVVGLAGLALGSACNRILDGELCERLVTKAQTCQMPDLEMSFEAICLKYKGERVNDIAQLEHFTELSCEDLKKEILNLSSKRQ